MCQMCRVSAGQSISLASLDCAVTLFVFILSNFFHFPVCNLNIFFVLVCVCVCASLFSSCCINYIAPHPPSPFHTPVLPPLPVIVAHLLVVFIANYYFLLIFAHIFISILFLALANELCAMQQAAPELGVAASALFYSPPHDRFGVCLCNFCGKLRVVCPAAVLHPFNPFSSLRPRSPPTPLPCPC